MKSVINTIFITMTICALVSCHKEPRTVAATGITLSQTSVELTEGESTRITATISPDNATNKKVIWSSDNSNVTVSDGTITGKKACTATVTAKSDDGGKTATCRVLVIERIIQVSSVSLDKTSFAITEGESETLSAIISPTNATDQSVTWSSSDESVASVSSGGVVTAKAAGSATITVKTNDGGKTATCSVTVMAKTVSVTGVSLSESSLSITEGDTRTLIATVTPENATDKSVSWTSSDESVATVSSAGEVIAKSAGSATITVNTNDGGKTATCSVTVKSKTISVTGVSLSEFSLSMEEGETRTLTATVTPENATDKSVTWSSSAESVATVSSTGEVTAKSVGSATITVKTTDGGMIATCYVSVKAKVIPVTGISLNKTSMTIKVGETQTLIATITPSDATDKTVTWKSSNTAVATVDSNGKVTAKSIGTATISATAGDITANCAVTVKKPDNTETIIPDGNEYGWD